MKLSQKDKSLVLLIIAVLVMLWGIFSFFSFIFFSATSKISDINKVIVAENKEWFNVSRPLEISDLKDRVILLDFWTYACVNCIHTLPEIKRIEKEFGNKVVVIGVHSAKFNNEKDSAEIRKAILRYDISHPVVNDSELKIWDNFSVKSWPTFILINPHGNVVETYTGEEGAVLAKKHLRKLVSKFKYQINRDPLPTLLESNNLVGNVLNFPTKLEYTSDFSYKNHHAPALFIANSGKNNIIAASLSGNMIAKIGIEKDGFEDGSFGAAAFNAPQGLLYDSGKLYIADTGNHALRVVDFKTGIVSTLIGSGERGEALAGVLEAKDVDLSSPTALEFFPDKNHIAIANSGTHQILSYDINKNMLSVLAGNGEEGIDDGGIENNSLAQTADMSAYGKKLYFVDSETSSLRVLDEKGIVSTLIGQDLFKFGYENGTKDKALMQHPLGLMVDDTGAYISDSFNHIIRKYDFASKTIRNLVGARKRGEDVGSANKTQFDGPEGIVATLGNFYIADSNNNRIIAVNRASLNAEILDIMPPLKLNKESFVEYLPNLQKMELIKVKSDADISLTIDVNKGWKINEMGPSFINLLELVKDHQANLVTSFDWNMIKGKSLTLPKLTDGKEYILQGTIYYCEDKKNALCYVKSHEQKITADSDEKVVGVEVKLGY